MFNDRKSSLPRDRLDFKCEYCAKQATRTRYLPYDGRYFYCKDHAPAGSFRLTPANCQKPVTTVIEVDKKHRTKLLRRRDFVYVGWPALGFQGDPFGNFYHRIGADRGGPDALLTLAVALVQSRDDDAKFDAWFGAANDLERLRGKQLGCLCLDWDGGDPPPLTCHAVLLALAADDRWDVIEAYIAKEQAQCPGWIFSV